MKRDDCFYCTQDGRFHDYLKPLCQVNGYWLYLFRDQKHLGRVVFATDQHYDEPFELSPEEQASFWQTAMAVSAVIKEIFGADKMNFAIYGDLMSHLHIHIVPKYKDGLQWGGPFTDDVEKRYLDNCEYRALSQKICQALKDKELITA